MTHVLCLQLFFLPPGDDENNYGDDDDESRQTASDRNSNVLIHLVLCSLVGLFLPLRHAVGIYGQGKRTYINP